MKNIDELNLGFSDAENYHRRDKKELFNEIFVRNKFLDKIMRPETFFVVGEKGTGKTAYAVFMANNYYAETKSQLKYIRETEYSKFIAIKRKEEMQLSDYKSVWKVIILLLLAESIQANDLDHNIISRHGYIKKLRSAIDEYYNGAFSPEIINALEFVENSAISTGILLKHFKVSGERQENRRETQGVFQTNLLVIEKNLTAVLSDIKMKDNRLLFIDGIDIRPDGIPFNDYLDCVKGLANAVWSLNSDVFPRIRDSRGRFRVILLLRPDIFSSLGLQNLANKLHDNSSYLDWRTTYPGYRTSNLFELCDKLLSLQQPVSSSSVGNVWDHYFPWKGSSTNPNRVSDDPFVQMLRLTYSRPRDIVTALHLLQEHVRSTGSARNIFTESDIRSNQFLTNFSEYLMSGIRDQLSFYYNDRDYAMFYKFFSFLGGHMEFQYNEFLSAYGGFSEYVLEHHDDIPEFFEKPDRFLQFLYETNILCYIEDTDAEPLFRWCYRERGPSNISPKVSTNMRYRIHYGLHKALNVGASEMRRK